MLSMINQMQGWAGKLSKTKHLPVVHAIFGPISDHQHTMIQLLAALLAQDAPAVELECHLIGFDCHGHRLLSYCLHQGFRVLRGHVLEAHNGSLRHGHTTVGLHAGPLLGQVRVALLRAHVVLLQVGEGQIHGPTITTHVAVVGAIHQLLLAQGDQASAGKLPCTLQGPRGGERPAGTAPGVSRTTRDRDSPPALVLGFGHGTLALPIHRERDRHARAPQHPLRIGSFSVPSVMSKVAIFPNPT